MLFCLMIKGDSGDGRQGAVHLDVSPAEDMQELNGCLLGGVVQSTSDTLWSQAHVGFKLRGDETLAAGAKPIVTSLPSPLQVHTIFSNRN